MINKVNFDEIKRVIAREGVNRRVFAGDNSMIVLNEIKASAQPAFHSHGQEQLTYILEGECEFIVGEDVVRMGKGDVILVPPNVVHALRPLGEETILNLDVFSPIREDYLA